MEEKRLTPMKAIRAKCLNCCCWNPNEAGCVLSETVRFIRTDSDTILHEKARAT